MKAVVKKMGELGVVLKDVDYIEGSGILIKTNYTGICGTDREIANNELEFVRTESGDELIIGHEAIGTVQDPGSSTLFKKGDLVVPMVRRPGHCRMCTLGRQDYCADGDFVEAGIRGKNGFMREYFRDDERFLIKVNDQDLRMLGVLTEPMKNVMKIKEVFYNLSNRIPWYCNDSTYSCKNLYIYGTGTEAMLISFVFYSMGFKIFMVNRHPVSDMILRIAKSTESTILNSSETGYEEFLKRNPPDLIIDAVGSTDILREGARFISNNGIVILFGTSGQIMSRNEDITGYLVDKNVSLAGSVDGSKENYREAIEFISSYRNKFPFSEMITGIGSPSEIEKINKKESEEIKYIIKW